MVDMSKARRQFGAQKRLSKRRGVGWELTFDEWWGIWEKSGNYPRRGPYRGQYVMARKWDCGPYAAHNVEIQSVGDNALTVTHRKMYRKPRVLVSSPIGRPLSAYGQDPMEEIIASEYLTVE